MNTIFDTSMFWDIGRTLTYNRLINIIVGNRGGGKSYGAKERCIEQFINKKEQFMYIRRFKDELKKPMSEFFKDIYEKYPDYEMKVEGTKFYIRLKPANEKEKWKESDVAGYGVELSTASNKKSIPYPFVTTMIFDEFLLDKGFQRYLEEEPLKLLNLYETVARPGTGHPRVVMFLLANAMSVTNPYFLFFNLKMPTKKDKNGKYIWTHPTRPILVEDVRNEKFIEAKKNTEFGKLVEGTAYADFSIENKFILDDDTFIEKKSQKARNAFNFLYKGKQFGVWFDYSEGKLWVSKNVDPSNTFYSFTMKDHKPNTLLLKSKYKEHNFKLFIQSFQQGFLYFESVDIKNLCYEVLGNTLY